MDLEFGIIEGINSS